LTWFFIKHCDTATSSLSGSVSTGHVTEGLTTVVDLQKPPVHDLHGQGAQKVLTLKMTYSHFIFQVLRVETYLILGFQHSVSENLKKHGCHYVCVECTLYVSKICMFLYTKVFEPHVSDLN
jgi:hypothetical protein